jgi:hypothetical protein
MRIVPVGKEVAASRVTPPKFDAVISALHGFEEILLCSMTSMVSK